MAKYQDRDGNEIGVLKAARLQARHPKEFREANPYANFRAPQQATESSAADVVAALDEKARAALTQNLVEGEEVLAVVHGVRNSAMIATDRRVFIFKKGMTAGAAFGSKFTSFDYRNISGVQLHQGMVTGSAVLDVAGAAPVGSSYWGNKNNDPWKAQNAIAITKGGDVQAEVAHLRELVTLWHDRTQPGRVDPAAQRDVGGDLLNQIKQLGELRDSGILSPAEFDAKKADLLARL